MDFYFHYLQENIKTIIGYWTRCCKNSFQKEVHKAGEFLRNEIEDAVTKSNDDKIVKQEPFEEVIILLEQ